MVKALILMVTLVQPYLRQPSNESSLCYLAKKTGVCGGEAQDRLGYKIGDDGRKGRGRDIG